MRVSIKVTPRARRPGVAPDGRGGLLVAVSEPAVDGRATQAALQAVASALGVRPRQVRLVTGATSRVKVVELDVDPAEVASLLGPAAGAPDSPR
ncbi:MAG: DUF167 domain-containing protein [Kineosporiaceae bacterium]